QNEAGYTAELIWGNGTDETLGDRVSVTVIATGFGESDSDNFEFGKKPEKVVMDLDADVPTNITQPVEDEVEEKTTKEVSNELEEPTLKTDVQEQPTLNFDTTATEVEETVSIKDEVEKVIFNLEDNVDAAAEQAVEEVNDDFTEEPTLKTEVEESTETDVTADDSTETTVQTEETNWNWSEVNDGEIEASTIKDEISFTDNSLEETTEDFTSESLEETSTENAETIVWNLNDDDSTDEVSAETTDFTFESKEETIEEITFDKKDAATDQAAPTDETEVEGPVYTNRIPDEEQLKRSQERILKIKELGMKMKTPSGINDLENEPAYKRRKINLDEIPHSSENPISRFTLSDDKDGKPKLNDDNSFLHDNVD
ncbi:MAG: hypothetical protein JKX68_10705, partial [Flavobacteriales bacterium]|nr:hypothetical protein [Flavobacteriales bacterium]